MSKVKNLEELQSYTEARENSQTSSFHQYTRLAMQSHLAMACLDSTGTILSASNKFCKLTGYSEEEITNLCYFELIFGKFDKKQNSFLNTMQSGKVFKSEVRFSHKDKSSVWMEIECIPEITKGKIEYILAYGMDISYRKNKNKNHAMQLKAISKSHCVVEFDTDGFIISANDNFLMSVGYTLDEIKGRHHKIFVLDADANGSEYFSFWNALKDGNFQVGEFCRIDKNLNPIWFQASYSPVFNSDGEVYKIVKYATDITSAKLKSDDFQSQIGALSSSQMTVELLLDGTVVTANQNFLNTFGYEISEIQGHHHRMFVSPEEVVSQAYIDFWEALAKGQYQSALYKRLGKNGRKIWIQASYNPILDRKGRPFKIVKFAVDVTYLRGEQDNIDNKLVEQETSDEYIRSDLMKQSIQDSPNGMALLDVNGTFLHINNAICDLLKLSPDELIGKRLDDFIISGSPLLNDNKLKDWNKGAGQFINEERQVRCADRTEIWATLHLSRERYRNDRDLALILQIQDISEVYSARQHKANFISTVSHELRTPLTSIRGALGLILAHGKNEFTDQQVNLISIAMKNSERLASLVNDILDMEKLSSGQAQFRIDDLCVNDLVEQAIELNEPYGREFGVNYTLEMPLRNSWIRTDPDRFQQVLSNLISNATKFTGRGSSVKIVGKMFEGMFRIGVIDCGPGVPNEFRGRIFQPFSQADGSETRQKGGSGLGLNISRQIVTRMGGEIGFENLEKSGCEFWFTVPTIKEPISKANANPKDYNGLNINVLHLDSDNDFSEVFSEVFASYFTVKRASSLSAVENIIQSDNIKCVIMDWDGQDAEILEAVKKIKIASPSCIIVCLSSEDRNHSSVFDYSFTKGRQRAPKIAEKIMELIDSRH